MAIIVVPYGNVGKLASYHKVSERTVNKALNGKTDSPRAKMIRATALQKFEGTLFVEVASSISGKNE